MRMVGYKMKDSEVEECTHGFMDLAEKGHGGRVSFEFVHEYSSKSLLSCSS